MKFPLQGETTVAFGHHPSQFIIVAKFYEQLLSRQWFDWLKVTVVYRCSDL